MSAKTKSQLGAWTQQTKRISANYLIHRDDDLILVDTTDNNVTITLPMTQSEIVQTCFRFRIMKVAAENTLAIAAAGSMPIVGETELTAINSWVEALTDGTAWYLFASGPR
jgi:hypothetical protein